jgi:hypothetical protein
MDNYSGTHLIPKFIKPTEFAIQEKQSGQIFVFTPDTSLSESWAQNLHSVSKT